jgi:hypothetical protein
LVNTPIDFTLRSDILMRLGARPTNSIIIAKEPARAGVFWHRLP